MAYKLTITERADELIDQRVNHLVNILKNEQAAKHLLDGIDKLYDRLEENPKQFSYCRDLYLKNKGYQEAVISDMDYILIFNVSDMDVFVVGFFHQLENYKEKL